MTVIVEYDSNNSGGDWWLADDNWRALDAAGWDVDWYAERDAPFFRVDAEGRWLGALAGGAKKAFSALRDGISEWERVTGQDARALGCNCCGPPHTFTARDPETGRVVDEYYPQAQFGQPY